MLPPASLLLARDPSLSEQPHIRRIPAKRPMLARFSSHHDPDTTTLQSPRAMHMQRGLARAPAYTKHNISQRRPVHATHTHILNRHSGQPSHHDYGLLQLHVDETRRKKRRNPKKEVLSEREKVLQKLYEDYLPERAAKKPSPAYLNMFAQFGNRGLHDPRLCENLDRDSDAAKQLGFALSALQHTRKWENTCLDQQDAQLLKNSLTNHKKSLKQQMASTNDDYTAIFNYQRGKGGNTQRGAKLLNRLLDDYDDISDDSDEEAVKWMMEDSDGLLEESSASDLEEWTNGSFAVKKKRKKKKKKKHEFFIPVVTGNEEQQQQDDTSSTTTNNNNNNSNNNKSTTARSPSSSSRNHNNNNNNKKASPKGSQSARGPVLPPRTANTSGKMSSTGLPSFATPKSFSPRKLRSLTSKVMSASAFQASLVGRTLNKGISGFTGGVFINQIAPDFPEVTVRKIRAKKPRTPSPPPQAKPAPRKKRILFNKFQPVPDISAPYREECFDKYKKGAVLVDIVRLRAQREAIHDVVWKYYDLLRKIFCYYACQGSNKWDSMSLVEYLAFCRAAKLVQGKTTVSQLDMIFRTVNLEAEFDEEKAELVTDVNKRTHAITMVKEEDNVDTELNQDEFIEAVVRIAILKFIKLKSKKNKRKEQQQEEQNSSSPSPSLDAAMEPHEAVQRLIERFIVPHAIPSFDIRLRGYLLHDDVQAVYTRHGVLIGRVFDKVCSIDSNPDAHAAKLISSDEALAFVKSASLFGQDLTFRECRIAFAMSQEENGKFESGWAEFCEFFARLAEYKYDLNERETRTMEGTPLGVALKLDLLCTEVKANFKLK